MNQHASQHVNHESVYDGLVEDHGDVSGQWAFGTSFEDPLAGVDTTMPEGVDGADLAAYCLGLGDDALVLSHRLSQWCSRAPDLEDDIAVANIALDLLGQALDQPVVDVGANDALHAPDTGIFHPNLARAVHQDFGYRIPFKPFPERRKVSVEIDAPFPVQIDGRRVLFRVVVRMEGMDIGAHDRVRLSLPLRSPDRAL